MSIKKRKPSNKQIIKDILNLTSKNGWSFRVVREWRESTLMPKKPGGGCRDRGTRTMMDLRCSVSGRTMQMVIDNFKGGKIRFRGVDPFKDRGPQYPHIPENATPEDNSPTVDIDSLSDEDKAALHELVRADDRDGVIQFLQERDLLPPDAGLPPPSNPQPDITEDLPSPEEVLAMAEQAMAEENGP